ncbi:hypothetical protein KFL_000530030 [Klebsormidium nitens]|uniref:Uncharacterized protein n=1 Tax=Klebsormidium nitens TaxID=105231 RepID=A0A1Y1HP16_KLENI|nr:hypothetical protein KFL_000530030 [Klebsormidium nitens]|eukprot:GAQ80375.1 hypothetical protein KFL_000530030 [Klebsormidium nitens]
MAVAFAGSSGALQGTPAFKCQLGQAQLRNALQPPPSVLGQAAIPLRSPLRLNRTFRVRSAESSDSSKDGGQGSGSTPLRAAPPRPGAAPPKLGAAPPKPGAAKPKMGPKPEAGPLPRPAAPAKPSTPSPDMPKPAQGPQPASSSGVVTSVKSPFGESSVDSPFGGSKTKSIFGEGDAKSASPFGESGAKNPFGERGAAKPAGKRVKIGTGSGTMSPYGKSTTSARYKPKAEAYPGRMPPDFGDSGPVKTTTKPATFRPDSSLFAEKSRIELKQEAQAAEKKWEITPGQILLGLSFVFSIVLMLGTFYLVYKVGGVHFNE